MSDEPEEDPIFDEANRLFDEEKYDEAIKLYDKLIVEKKIGAEPLFMKAECLSNLNRNEESITWYDKAIEIDDENPAIWNGKGNALYHLDNYVQARVCFECAYDLDPANTYYLFSIIETAILTDDLDDAVNMAREALQSTEVTNHVALSWGFSIIALFLRSKPLNAVETIDEFVQYMRDVEKGILPGEKFTGVDYDLCGVEKVIGGRIKGKTSEIMQAVLSYLKGEIDVEQLATIRAESSDEIVLDDVVMAAPDETEEEIVEQFPDIAAIVAPIDRASIEQINALVEEYAGEFGFQSFAYMFDEYNWNQDRGPAPFLEEISNKFFVDIVDGKVTRLSIDIDLLAKSLLPDGQKEAEASAAPFAQAGALLRFTHLEELFITAIKVSDVIETMRAASLGKGNEITLYLNVSLIPDVQEDFISLDKIDEITGIDEIPVDYQAEGKRIVGSMVWTATR